MVSYKEYYRRHLPHYQLEGAVYHVVFRLKGTLPADVIEQLQHERDQLKLELSLCRNDLEKRKSIRNHHWMDLQRFDDFINCCSSGPRWLQRPEIASIVKEAIQYRDGKMYDLLAFSIMSNHVHVVFVHRAGCPMDTVTNILRKLKWNTALKANRILQRNGPFWQDESYDHIIRDSAELERTIWYVLNNPVKAGLVQSREEWPWNYCKNGLLSGEVEVPL